MCISRVHFMLAVFPNSIPLLLYNAQPACAWAPLLYALIIAKLQHARKKDTVRMSPQNNWETARGHDPIYTLRTPTSSSHINVPPP